MPPETARGETNRLPAARRLVELLLIGQFVFQPIAEPARARPLIDRRGLAGRVARAKRLARPASKARVLSQAPTSIHRPISPARARPSDLDVPPTIVEPSIATNYWDWPGAEPTR